MIRAPGRARLGIGPWQLLGRCWRWDTAEDAEARRLILMGE